MRESCAVTSKRRSFINGWANQPFECVQLTCCNSFFVFRFFFWDFDVWEVKTENWKGKKKEKKRKKKVSFGLLSNAESGTYFPMKMGWENQPEEQWDFAEMATTSHHCLIVAGMTTNSKSIYIQSISHHAFLVRFWKKTSAISEHYELLESERIQYVGLTKRSTNILLAWNSALKLLKFCLSFYLMNEKLMAFSKFM